VKLETYRSRRRRIGPSCASSRPDRQWRRIVPDIRVLLEPDSRLKLILKNGVAYKHLL
jgi:hypothetical protein